MTMSQETCLRTWGTNLPGMRESAGFNLSLPFMSIEPQSPSGDWGFCFLGPAR